MRVRRKRPDRYSFRSWRGRALSRRLSTPAFAADPADGKAAPTADSQKKGHPVHRAIGENTTSRKPGDEEQVNDTDCGDGNAAVTAADRAAAGGGIPGKAKPA